MSQLGTYQNCRRCVRRNCGLESLSALRTWARIFGEHLYYLSRGAIEQGSLVLFPRGNPDETLRSIIARYSVINSIENQLRVFKKVFQRACLNERFYAEDLRVLTMLVAREGHTEDIYSKMLYEHTYHSLLLNFTDTNASDPFGRYTDRIDDFYLRDSKFCNSCIERDYETIGFTFWRRSHQMPGVTCCWEHSELLKKIQSTHSSILDSRKLFDAKTIRPGGKFTASTVVDETAIQFAKFARDALSIKALGSGVIKKLIISNKHGSLVDFTNGYMQNYCELFGNICSLHESAGRRLLAAYKLFGSVEIMLSSIMVADGGPLDTVMPDASNRFLGC